MATTINTEDIINEKREDSTNTNKSQQFGSDIGKFFVTLALIIAIIIVYISLGSLALYGCKLGQSNILPTNDKCFPYTDTKPIIESIFTNIFTTTFTDPAQSVKLKFPYDNYNSKNKIIGILRDYKNEPHSHFLINYFIALMEGLISFNYSSLNFILNLMNGLPEPLIILLGPIILSIFSTLLLLIDNFYLIYLWFANMGWFFKQNNNTASDHKPLWENVTIMQPINYWLAFWFVWIFCILFFVLLFFALPVLPVLTVVTCLLSGLGYIGEINNNPVSAATIILDVFKYYKAPIMSIFSFFVILSAFANLGIIPGIFSIITLILIFWGVISIDLFKPINPEMLSKVVSNNQATKTCDLTGNISTSNKHGFLYNLVFPQKGGNRIIHELKKIGKKLEK